MAGTRLTSPQRAKWGKRDGYGNAVFEPALGTVAQRLDIAARRLDCPVKLSAPTGKRLEALEAARIA